MLKHIFLCCLVLLLVTPNLIAQDEEELPAGWTSGAGLGLDFAQLLQINPRQGAGQNRIGFGGAVNYFAKYRRDRLAWDNLATWQFGIQRLGSGIIAQGNEERRVPFQKAIDDLRFNSKVGYQTSQNSNFFYAADMSFLTQLTPTYQGSDEYPGNFLSDITGQGNLLSKFFNPGTLNLSVGMDWKPNDKFSLYYSPIGAKFIFVPDDFIASLGVHGNPVEGDRDPDTGRFTTFDNAFSALGQTLRANYATKFLAERGTFTSSMLLFSNYLENPQNIDVDWTNELALTIVAGLQAAVTVNVFYDDDVLVQITDWDEPNGVSGLGKRVSITQQFLLKYNVTF
jgi:opacity protein-like surface antigen